MMINVLFFTFIEKYVVAMRCYGYCSLIHQIQPVRYRGQKISILGPLLLD